MVSPLSLYGFLAFLLTGMLGRRLLQLQDIHSIVNEFPTLTKALLWIPM